MHRSLHSGRAADWEVIPSAAQRGSRGRREPGEALEFERNATAGKDAMACVDWLLTGPKIASCNCDYGCPCEFNGRPTRHAALTFVASAPFGIVL
jgi:hypothetical protein